LSASAVGTDHLRGEGNVKRALLVALVVLAAAPAAGSAQAGSIEIGVDGGIQLLLPEERDNVTTFFAPGNWIRFAFGASSNVGIETEVGFTHSTSDDNSATGLHLFPSIVYNISPDWGETWFVRGGAGLTFSDVDTAFGDVGSTQFGIGGGVGARLPVTDAFSIRLEGAVEHWFEDDDDREAFNLLQFLVGFSFFVD
jgi:hypothetical protein